MESLGERSFPGRANSWHKGGTEVRTSLVCSRNSYKGPCGWLEQARRDVAGDDIVEGARGPHTGGSGLGYILRAIEGH